MNMTDHQMTILGRCPMDGGALWLTFPLSGVAFSLKNASFLRFRLRADMTAENPDFPVQKARYAVYINGGKATDALMMTKRANLEYRDLNPEETYEIRLLKLSECTQSLMAIEDLETDGTTEKIEEKPFRIEFIGDSITCGYGVEGLCGEETFSTATENAEKGYAALTARALNADAQLNSYSGFGIVSGYTGDPAVRAADILVPMFYEKTGLNSYRLPSGKCLQETEWDFSGFEPQVVVINLGTNDLSWCQNDPERKDFFRREYAKFLKTVRKRRSGARILCVLGVMGTGLNEAMTAAVKDYRMETGDPLIRSLALEEQDQEKDGVGSDFHPSAITQKKLAEKVTTEIQSWLRN